MTQIYSHTYDLPDNVILTAPYVAIDTETMGLLPSRDRLCVVQLSAGDGTAHLVHFPTPDYERAINLKILLANQKITKLFHYARFDVAVLFKNFNILVNPIYCTKIASKLVRTYTDRHGLKELCRELGGIEISKQEQSSYWGNESLSEAQQRYAANDVLHLHAIKEKLDTMLDREGRMHLAQECFKALPNIAAIDLHMGQEFNIFDH